MQRREHFEPSTLEELESLAESAGYTVIGRLEQIRQQDSRYQIGSGKVQELARLVEENNAQRTIFDNQLKPVQAYNLAKATAVEAIDRFQLILEIFARRATTNEAKLQIQLARLRYELTRAKERVRLAKKEEQPGFMGLGAYEVDVYFETVKRRIQSIRNKLRRIRKRRILHRKRRTELGFQSISLAGYTNAGKSSLFNSLTEEEVLVDEGLFTTLSTTTRLVKILEKKILLTDTVGFIDRLPLKLIEAFNSTLEETIYSDLILLVVDVSEPIDLIKKKLSCCLQTIAQIGASGIPKMTILNKIDLLSETELSQKLITLNKETQKLLPVSALYRSNLKMLKQEIQRKLDRYIQASLTVPLTDDSMSFISWLHNRVEVLELKYTNNQVYMVFESIPWFAEKVRKQVEKEFKGKLQKTETINL
ncbi:MAG: GTPase HflX [Candidatus Bathyarchaeota archaeon]